VAAFYITVQGLPEGHYTDQWLIDPANGWTAGDLRDNICAVTACVTPGHILTKDATPLDLGAAAAGQLSGGDIVVRGLP